MGRVKEIEKRKAVPHGTAFRILKRHYLKNKSVFRRTGIVYLLHRLSDKDRS